MVEKIKIVFLGTSDAVPSAGRNHPAFLLTYLGENILVDCGEGTQRQFRRAGINPCKLTKILITHWHADHILGLPGLIKTLGMSGYRKRLEICGPKGTKAMLDQLLRLFEVKKEFPIETREVSGKFFESKDFYLEAQSMSHGIPCNAYSFVKKEQIRIDKAKLRKFGIKEGKHIAILKKGKSMRYNGKTYKAKDLTFKAEGKKISFVLDTSFNDKIERFVKGSDAFICELHPKKCFRDKHNIHMHYINVVF